jgi:hypothetical protein
LTRPSAICYATEVEQAESVGCGVEGLDLLQKNELLVVGAFGHVVLYAVDLMTLAKGLGGHVV